MSLEGNLTVEDAYFSGATADYDSAESFRAAFLDRLDIQLMMPASRRPLSNKAKQLTQKPLRASCATSPTAIC